ncbi:MAG: hypothetical protein IPL55_24000 [Saprospiraceae bacterium]|nr:hypothetical protein [Saprospiraceae bacterium]
MAGLTEINIKDDKMFFTANSGMDIRQDIFRIVVEHGLTLIELKQGEATMEDIFRKLTKIPVDA